MSHVAVGTLRRSAIALRVDRRAATVAAGLALVPVLAVNGGYFPTAWGWTAVGFAWAAALAIVLGGELRLSTPEWAFAGGLACLAVWSAASTAWSSAPTQSPLETERLLAYVAAALAVAAIGRRSHVRQLLGAVGAAAAAICAYALATRLFPDRLGVFDPVANYRLSTPVGYWNSLGLVAAMAVLLAAAVLGGARRRLTRSVAAGSLPVLLTALYFTYSRGAWISLFLGLVVLVAYDRRRLELVVRVLPSAAVAAGSVMLAARERALTHVDASAGAAAHDGHRFAAVVLMLVVLSALAAALADTLARVVVAPQWRRAATAVLLLAVLGAAAAGFVRFGSPSAIVRRAYDSFVAPPPSVGANLNARLFSLSGSGRWTQWKVALHAFESHPVLGVGAGGYERYWLQHRPLPGKIRDAHSLYLETLAETGLVGFALLLAVLAAPLLALRRARHERLAAGALAAYVAYLVHAGADWDWELSGVTLLAFFCAGALMLAGRGDRDRRAPQALLLPLALTVAVAGLIGLVGNIALAKGNTAARAGDWRAAAHEARTARRWAPWSAQPWQQLGQAQLGLGDSAAARASFLRAISESPGDWSLWFDLARASTGTTQTAALAHAHRLNPLSPEVAELENELATQGSIGVVEQ